MSDAALFAKLAKPVLDLGTYLGAARADDLEPLLNEAKTRLDTFEREAIKAGALDSSTAAARYGLLVILDGKGRNNPNVPLKRWSAGVHGTLFEGRDVSLNGLKDLHRKAAEAGGTFKPIGTFLQHCIDAAESSQAHTIPPNRSISKKALIGGALLVITAAAIGLLWMKNAASQRVTTQLDAPYRAVISQAASSPEQLAMRLDALLSATEAVKAENEASLLGRLLFMNPVSEAEALYRDALRVTLPRVLNQSLQRSLSQEENPRRIYDSLRAMAILERKSPWSAGYLAGWADSGGIASDDLTYLADHIAQMEPLTAFNLALDTETLTIAREIALESTLEDRAYLELTRLDQVLALPDIVLTDRINGLESILIRRSNTPLSKPIPGLYSRAGWAISREKAATLALEKAKAESLTLLGDEATQPVSPALILSKLQTDTNTHWRQILDDLRVRPFDDQASSIRISGALGSPRNPLTDLFALLWAEVGGTDRTRTHKDQLAIAINFGPLIQYVEQGKMAEVSQLFSGLNVALATLSPGDQVSSRRLMDVNARARSISALSTAPIFVSQIVEDVLTQAAGATSDAIGNPVQLLWEQDGLAACRAVLTGRYPFSEGDDADISAFRDLFGTGGILDRFERNHLTRLLDKGETNWRWTPEALFTGFSRDTAQFFQTAYTLREGLFGGDKSMDTELLITSLGQSGPTTLSIGGQTAPISNETPPVSYKWPGDQPRKGVEVAFTDSDSLRHAGPWGLFRLLDTLRLRPREDGKRYRIDFKGTSGRLFVDIEFETAINPVSLRPLLKDLTCPAKL